MLPLDGLNNVYSRKTLMLQNTYNHQLQNVDAETSVHPYANPSFAC